METKELIEIIRVQNELIITLARDCEITKRRNEQRSAELSELINTLVRFNKGLKQ